MIRHALMSGASVFLANAVVLPLEQRYKAWKASRPEIILKRNWRGQLVPDLTVKRLERTAWLLLIALIMLGCAVGYTVMSPTGPYATAQNTTPGVPIVRTVKVE